MSWLSEGAIEAALEVSCDACGVPAGVECVTLAGGTPLLEEIGTPCHYLRLESVDDRADSLRESGYGQ